MITGVLNSNLNGDNIISVPLKTNEQMNVGYIKHEKAYLSNFAISYLDELKRLISEYENLSPNIESGDKFIQ